MEVFIAIVSLVCSILSIILFFKVWGMCNDVAEMNGIAITDGKITFGDKSYAVDDVTKEVREI